MPWFLFRTFVSLYVNPEDPKWYFLQYIGPYTVGLYIGTFMDPYSIRTLRSGMDPRRSVFCNKSDPYIRTFMDPCSIRTLRSGTDLRGPCFVTNRTLHLDHSGPCIRPISVNSVVQLLRRCWSYKGTVIFIWLILDVPMRKCAASMQTKFKSYVNEYPKEFSVNSDFLFCSLCAVNCECLEEIFCWFPSRIFQASAEVEDEECLTASQQLLKRLTRWVRKLIFTTTLRKLFCLLTYP